MAGRPFVFVALWFSASAAAADFTTANLRQAGYFEFLDYNIPAVAARIPAYDARLRAQALAKTDPLDKDSALFLVYVGLFIANTDYGVAAGRLSLETLAAAGKASPGDGLSNELAAREALALGFFERAQVVLSEDKRISGWIAGARIRLDVARNGKPSRESVALLLEAAEAYPLFNLFSGLILAHDYDLGPEADRRLFEMVKLMTSDKSPCKESGAHCGSSDLAPFADQGAAVLMADAYLKHGAALLGDTDKANDKEGNHDAGMALILYTSPYVKSPAKTHRWPQIEALNRRSEEARAFMRHRKPLDDPWSSASARAVHQCSSCHSKK